MLKMLMCVDDETMDRGIDEWMSQSDGYQFIFSNYCQETCGAL